MSWSSLNAGQYGQSPAALRSQGKTTIVCSILCYWAVIWGRFCELNAFSLTLLSNLGWVYQEWHNQKSRSTYTQNNTTLVLFLCCPISSCLHLERCPLVVKAEWHIPRSCQSLPLSFLFQSFALNSPHLLPLTLQSSMSRFQRIITLSFNKQRKPDILTPFKDR